MGKKKQSAIASGLSALLEMLFSSITTKVDHGADVLIHKVESKVDKIVRNVEARMMKRHAELMKQLQVSALNGLAWLLLLFALFFYLVESNGVSRADAFFYLGFLLLLLSFYLKYRHLKERG